LVEGKVLPAVYLNGKYYEVVSVNGKVICNITNLQPGNYTLKILWKGVIVYEQIVSLENNTVVVANCSVLSLSVSVVDGGDNPLELSMLLLRDEGGVFNVSSLNGELKTLLPFGVYTIGAVYYGVPSGRIVRIMPMFNYTVNVGSGGVNVTAGSETVSKLVFRVYGLTIRLRYNDKSLLTGRISERLLVKIYINNVYIVFEGRPDWKGVVRVGRLPEATYRLEVFLDGIKFYNSTLKHSTEEEIIYVLPISSEVTLQFIDEWFRPVPNSTVILRGPLGFVRRLSTDRYGMAILEDAVEGVYKASLLYRGVLLNTTFTLRGERLKLVSVKLLVLVLFVESEGIGGLPDGLVLILESNGVVVNRTVLSAGESHTLTFYGLQKGNYRVSVIWQNVTVYDGVIILDEPKQVDIKCKIYSMKVFVADLDGDPATNIRLFITHPNGSAFPAVPTHSGWVNIRYLPGGVYLIKAVDDHGLLVGEKTILLNKDLENEVVRVSTRTVLVKAVGVFGQPLHGVNITFKMFLTNGTQFILGNGVTDYEGETVFQGLPILDYDYLVDAWLGKVSIKNLLVQPGLKQEIVLKLDVVAVYGTLVLTTLDVLALSLLIPVSMVVGVVLRWYLRRREISGIITPVTGEGAEGETYLSRLATEEEGEEVWSSGREKTYEKLLKKVKRVFKRRKKKAFEELEEYEEDLFG